MFIPLLSMKSATYTNEYAKLLEILKKNQKGKLKR